MLKIKKLSYLLLTVGLLSSCEYDKEQFSGAYQDANESTGSKEDQARLNALTNNGTTLPGTELTGIISNPGDIPKGGPDCPPPEAPYMTVSTKGSSKGNYTTNKPDPKYIYSLKGYKVPARGCIPAKDVSLKEAKALMKSQNLTARGRTTKENPTEMEIRSIGAGLKRIQELNGGPLKTGMGPGSKPYPFVFNDGEGSSSQGGSSITISRKKVSRTKKGHQHYGLSVAQHVHEYAHLVGNNGGYSNYVKFMGKTGKCMVSNYADNGKPIGGGHTGEQFAEVFTAFVTDPSSLLNNSRTSKNCRKAFDFFTQWFNKGEKVKSCL